MPSDTSRVLAQLLTQALTAQEMRPWQPPTDVYRLADGSRVLRVEDLNTSNGPALHVWLSDAPVIEGSAGWSVFDDGRYVDLGELKGNIGSSNYPIPPEVDLAALSSVSIWCARFHVSFAATRLVPSQ